MAEIEKTYKVIVVDDSIGYQNNIRTKLESRKDVKINVLVAENKEVGLSCFEDNIDTDLMIIDLDLDEAGLGQAMDSDLGMILIDEVRSTKKKLPIICCTGTGDETIKKLCEEKNVVYIKKYSMISPPRELYAKVVSLLNSLKK